MARGLNVFVNIGAKVGSSVNSSASAVERRMSAMGRRLRVVSAETAAMMASTERRWGKFSDNARNFAYSVSAPMAGLAAIGARTAYEWEKVGNELQAVTQMTNAQRKSIEAVARSQIGNPAENLKAALDLARSGFDTNQIAGAMPTVLRMAKADPSVDTAAAADIATNIIQGMRVPVEQFEHAADQLAFAASKSSTDIRLLGLSFKYAGPIAARMGSNMDQMSAAFMTMANAGIKGSESGVAMRSMFVRMVKPTKGGVAALDQLGLNLGDYVKGRRAGNGEDVANFLRTEGVDINKQAMAGIDKIIASGLTGGALYSAITEAVVSAGGEAASAIDRAQLSSTITDALTSQADQVDWVGFMTALRDKGATVAQINTIFDSRQGTRLMTLMSGNDLNRNLKLMQEGAPGWLLKMFTVSTKGTVGAFGRLTQSFGNLMISMAESGVIDTIARGMDWLSNSMMKLSKSSPGTLKALTYGILGLAALGPIMMGVGGIVSGLKMVGGMFSLAGAMAARFGPAMLRLVGPLFNLRGALMGLRLAAAVGLGPLIAVGWPAVAVIAALALAIGWVIAKWDGIKAFFTGFGEGFKNAISPETMANMEKLGSALSTTFGMIANVLRPVTDLLGAAWGWLSKIFAPANTEAWNAAGVSFGGVIGGMVDWLGKFVGLLATAIEKMNTFFSSAAGKQMIGGMFLGNPAGAAKGVGTMMGEAISGKRASGGNVRAGGLYRINERGQEFFAPGRSGTVIPARATAALMAAANSNTAGGGGMPPIGQLHIHGANDPESTRRIVREEFRRVAREQRSALGD